MSCFNVFAQRTGPVLGPVGPVSGGDLGPVSRSTFVPQFLDSVFWTTAIVQCVGAVCWLPAQLAGFSAELLAQFSGAVLWSRFAARF